MSDSTLDVLVVDDDELTAEVLERAIKKVSGDFRIVVANDGRDGLDVLYGKTDRRVARPFVILLDLNMPTMNGFEFLEELRKSPNIRDSIVFVLTTSDADSDRSKAYHELIAGYMVKSAVGPQFSRLAVMLQQYAAAVRLPE